jgi:hypothetical protein
VAPAPGRRPASKQEVEGTMQDYDIDGWLEAAYEEKYEADEDYENLESFFEPDSEDDPEQG